MQIINAAGGCRIQVTNTAKDLLRAVFPGFVLDTGYKTRMVLNALIIPLNMDILRAHKKGIPWQNALNPLYILMEPTSGVEPLTYALRVRCSTC